MKKRLITTFLAAMLLSLPGAHALANDAGAPVTASETIEAPVALDDAPAAPEAPSEAEEVTTPEATAEEANTAGADAAVKAPDPGTLKDIYDAGKGGDWRSFVVLLLMFLVGFMRWAATKWERLDRMLNSEGDWSGAMLVFGLSLMGAFATAWQADGATMNFALFQAAAENAILAFGGYSVLWKKLVKPKLDSVVGRAFAQQ